MDEREANGVIIWFQLQGPTLYKGGMKSRPIPYLFVDIWCLNIYIRRFIFMENETRIKRVKRK